MRAANQKTLLSLIYVAGVSTFAQPAICVETVEIAQARLKEMEAIKEQHPGGYARALFVLAEAQYANKEDTQAEVTFRQCLPFYYDSSSDYKEGAYAAALLNWAGVLLRGNGNPIDLAKADSLILEGLEKIDEVSDKLARVQTYQGAILLFRKTGNIKEEQHCITFLLDSCAECEANKNADLIQTRRAAMTLSWIAQRICPLSPGAVKSKPLTKDELAKRNFNEDQFEIAEKLIVRAIGLCDRTSKLNGERSWLHRLLSRWYSRLGKLDLANEQERLAKKFAPAETLRTRGGCGRTIGKITGAGVISGACGMG